MWGLCLLQHRIIGVGLHTNSRLSICTAPSTCLPASFPLTCCCCLVQLVAYALVQLAAQVLLHPPAVQQQMTVGMHPVSVLGTCIAPVASVDLPAACSLPWCCLAQLVVRELEQLAAQVLVHQPAVHQQMTGRQSHVCAQHMHYPLCICWLTWFLLLLLVSFAGLPSSCSVVADDC